MRILLVSDLHYTLKQMDWVLRVAGDFDLVIVAGDHLDMGSLVDHDAQIVASQEFLRRLATRTAVVACSGSHDLNDRDGNGEKAACWLRVPDLDGVHVDGDTFAIDDVLVTVCPFWDGPMGRDAIGEQLRAVASTRARRQGESRTWVWVYHVPPDASPTSWTGRRHYGDEDLVEWARALAPDIVCCGHVHESPFVTDGTWASRIGRAWAFNAGRQRGPIPTCVEIDTVARRASWHSLAGDEQLSFDDAGPAELVGADSAP